MRVNEELVRKHQPSRDTRHQALRKDTGKTRRQLHTDLVLLVWRKGVDDTVDRLRRVVGVQCGKDEMACFCGGNRGGNGLKATHLSNEYDVHVLTKRRMDTRFKGACVNADFALVDDALLGRVDVFNWVLDGDDMLCTVFVDVLHHCGKRGGFALTDRPDNEKEALAQLGKTKELLGYAEYLQRLNVRRLWP